MAELDCIQVGEDFIIEQGEPITDTQIILAKAMRV